MPDWEHPGQVKRLEQMCAGSFTEARLRQEGYPVRGDELTVEQALEELLALCGKGGAD